MTTIVLLSGGMDSAICLHWALRNDDVIAVSFDYGQEHNYIEFQAAMRIADNVHVPLERFVLPRLFSKEGDVFPHRNSLLLSAAAARASHYEANELVIGACLEDAEGFPDCRREFFDEMERALSLSNDRPMIITTPLLDMTKREALDLADELGCMEAVRMSWSCYHPVPRGARAPKPCGQCAACVKREAALCG